jgi:hypothetical protein
MKIAVIRNGVHDHEHVLATLKALGLFVVDVHSLWQIRIRHIDLFGTVELRLNGFDINTFDQIFFLNWPLPSAISNDLQEGFYHFAEIRAAAVAGISEFSGRVVNFQRVLCFNEILEQPHNQLSQLEMLGWDTPSVVYEFSKSGDFSPTYAPDIIRLPKYSMVCTGKGYFIASPYPAHGIDFDDLAGKYQVIREYLLSNDIFYLIVPFVSWERVLFGAGLSTSIPRSMGHSKTTELLEAILGR